MDNLHLKDVEVRKWLENPHQYFKAFSRVAKRFQHEHPSPRYRVMTLVGRPEEFLSRRPMKVGLFGHVRPVSCWEEVLAAIAGEIAAERSSVMRDVCRAGLAPWIAVAEGMDVVEAFAVGAVALNLPSLEEAFLMAQWLLLMADVKLNEAIVQVDPFTDEEWSVRSAQLREKRENENRVLREIDDARRRYAEAHPEEAQFAPAPDESGFLL